MDILIEPFEFAFFRNGAAAAVLAGALCGMIGVYVVLRGMSYIGHGLSHAIFGWSVISVVLNVNFYAGAAFGGFVSALAVNGIARRRVIGADAAIGVTTTAVFALGIALVSRARGFQRNFEAALFGNVLGVRLVDVAIVGAVLLAVSAVVVLRYRPLLFTTFDPEVADASGIRTGNIDSLLAMCLAGTIVVSMQVLGVMLVAAALVIPPVVARLLTDSFGRMLILSTAIGAAGGLAGIYLSYFLNAASGPTIVLVEAAAFVVVFAATGRRRARLAGTKPEL